MAPDARARQPSADDRAVHAQLPRVQCQRAAGDRGDSKAAERRLSAQHAERAAARSPGHLPRLRRRRHAAPDELRQRALRVPQPLHPHRRVHGGAAGRPRAVRRPDRQARAGPTPRLGRARRAQGHLGHRRDRARRQGADDVLPVWRTLPAGRPLAGGAGRVRLGRASAARWRAVGPRQGGLAQRRPAVLQLRQASALHALRRSGCERPAGALRAGAAARPAPAARHGLHRALRHPQRLPPALGRNPAGPGQAQAQLLP